MKRLAAFVLLLTLSVSIGVVPVRAALAPVGVSVRMTRQTAGSASNFDVRFSMEAGVSSVGDTITLTFDTGFSLASIAVADIDLLHGASYGTSETLASLAGAGTWGVAISGQTITFTPPTDVGAAEIVDGEQVAIRIGTNATGGTNQVTNPSIAGRYEVSVGGGFEGFGTSIVTIVSSSSGGVSVGFTVPAGSSGGSTGGTGGGAAGAAAGPGSTGTAPPPATVPTPEPTPTPTPTPTTPTDTDAATGSPSPSTTLGGAAGTGSSSASGAGSAGAGSAGSGTSVGTGASAGPSGGGASASSGASGPSGGGTVGTTLGGGTIIPTATTTPPLIPTAPTEEVPFPPVVATATEPTASTSTATSPAVSGPRFTWEAQGIQVSAANGGRIRVYPGEQVVLRVEGVDASSVGWIEFEGSRYALSSSASGQVATLEAEATAGSQQGTVTIREGNGRERYYPVTLEVVLPLQVFEKDVETRTPAKDVELSLFMRSSGRWTSMGTVSSAAGAYRRYLTPGTYRVEAKKKGWRTIRQEVTLTTAGAISGEVVLDKELVSPLSVIQKDAPFAENVTRVAEATADAVGQIVEQVRTPEAQAVAAVAAPAAVVATVGATAAAASSFNVLAYLRFLLTQPALLVRRRRREKWGLVYNAVTKQPVDLAIIRLIDAATGAVKQTRITDAQGRFAFLAGAGRYRFQVVKPGYTFPTSLLAKETVDVELVDLYHGEPVEVQAGTTLTPNIPIDPVEKTETPAIVLRKRRLRVFQQVLSVGSLVIAGVAFILQPTLGMGLFGLGQVAAFFIFRRLAVPPKPKNWGIVYDGRTRKPLARAVVRVFDRKYNKLLETQVTDRDGKYAFFAGKNIYYVTADLPGYERFVSPEIDLRKEALGVIREPVALLPKAL